MGGISVRIFPAGDFAAPQDWPADVGIAVISGDGLQVFPVHARESGAAILTRIAALSGLDLAAAGVHPPVPGHPPCDLPFSAVADLQAAVEAFLSRQPEALEEAEDFAVNFGFAVEEGITFPALAPQTAQTPPPAVAEAPPPPDGPPPGYAALADAAPTHACPVLRLTGDGRMMVVLDPDLPVLSTLAPPVFLRDDGLGLAIPSRALAGPDAAGAGLILPEAALPWLPRGAEGDIPLIAVLRGEHLLLSFRPDWAWPMPPAAPEAAHAVRWRDRLPAFARHLRHGPAGLAAVAAVLVLGLGIGGAWRGAPDAPPAAPAAPVDALRAGLFD